MLVESPNSTCQEHLTHEVVVRYVKEVEAYCQLFCDLKPCGPTSTLFRSSQLAEAANRVFPDSCHSKYSKEMALAFDEFYVKRSTLLKERNVPQSALGTSNPSMQLLVVNWDQSLFDGACSPITQGFINDDCLPGWDTWIALVSLGDERLVHGLLCWVPPELVRRVDDAIRVDAAQCMSWLKKEAEQTFALVGWGKALIPC